MARQSWVQKQRPDGTFDLVARDELAAWTEKHYPKRKAATATLKFKRPERGRWIWRDGELIQLSAEVIPLRARGIQIVRDIEPFVNIAVDNKVIGGRRQKRDMMRAHGVVEAGDMPRLPQNNGPRYDAKKHQLSVVESLKKALHQHGLGD